MTNCRKIQTLGTANNGCLLRVRRAPGSINAKAHRHTCCVTLSRRCSSATESTFVTKEHLVGVLRKYRPSSTPRPRDRVGSESVVRASRVQSP